LDNADPKVVEAYGKVWERFKRRETPDVDRMFGENFELFPWERLGPHAEGFDAGCGSGHWAQLVAPRVGRLHCIDASAQVISVARELLAGTNCEFHLASVSEMPLADASQDFGYSVGVLHHIPDTLGGLKACTRKLKPGAPFLLYLYYAFDNRPWWFRMLWRSTEWLRFTVSRLPFGLRARLTDLIAALIYWPLARTAGIAERVFHLDVDAWPLSYYRNLSFYSMRGAALDRFGTRLEQRFTRAQIEAMMQEAGLTEVRFRNGPPYWCAVGIRH
jgi:ubiquinone/menaquinone biosynthesis C-methylase UbiE